MKDDSRNDSKFDEVISDALRKGSDLELPHNFADRVMKIIQQRAAVREAKLDRWWLIAGVVGMIVALVYAMVAVEFKPGVGVFTFLSGYWGLIIFGVLFVTALHVIDKRIVSHRSHR